MSKREIANKAWGDCKEDGYAAEISAVVSSLIGTLCREDQILVAESVFSQFARAK